MASSSHTVAFVFPGQGSQRTGMLDQVPPVPGLDRLLDAAEALTGMPLRELACDGPDDALSATLVAQPLLYIADWAWATALEDAGVRPVAAAGHSLGELAALAFASAFSVEAGLELVCERARLMASATQAHPGAMAAVLGMDVDLVKDLSAGLPDVWVANDNGPGQIVLAGTHAGISAATQAFSEAGARKIVPLNVAGAFHSPLMATAAADFGDIIRATAFSDARLPIVQNASPTPAIDGDTLRERLIAQMDSPVRWTETMLALAGSGVDLLVETGPGGVLAGLARRVENLDALAAETVGVTHILEVTAA